MMRGFYREVLYCFAPEVLSWEPCCSMAGQAMSLFLAEQSSDLENLLAYFSRSSLRIL